ncbi:MAG: type I restriction enzyme HsdR N-terminal domain-containing protein [Methanobacterium paludis]|nr:type I restriction enzyme HsdR N-terminal domain-containing protein [Methanobacterium paludis]
MENTLFNQHRMDKYAKDKSFKIKPSQHDLIKKHIEKLGRGELKAETSNYLYFFDVFLRDILGYDREENVLFDETVDKGAKRSEFVLKNDDEKFMIVELKGQLIELDKPQQGHGGKTPVKQAMDYSYDTNSANWVMVSNYDEFRLYNYHEKTHYISFKVEELLDPKIFSYFMLVFSKKSHLNEKYPQKLLDDTFVVDKELEKNFYNLYHETRLMLVKELEYGGCNREKAVEHAQTILNRYIFICFAEDTKGLLPEEISIKTIINPLKEGIVGKNKIWTRLNELFADMDTGDRVGINQFNGKLFCKDLSSLPIRDLVEDPKFFEETWQKYDFEGYSKDIKPLIKGYEKNLNPIYKNLLLMSTFDFSSQLDVNILGHIFENSIGDIEYKYNVTIIIFK